MAKYVIRIWDEASLTKEREEIRRTRPSAFTCYQQAVYDVLAAFGKLDTEAAYHAIAASEAAADLMQIGYQRGMLVSNTGKRVNISRVA